MSWKQQNFPIPYFHCAHCGRQKSSGAERFRLNYETRINKHDLLHIYPGEIAFEGGGSNSIKRVFRLSCHHFRLARVDTSDTGCASRHTGG
ncbi:hypothetical protein CDAR_208661 [Caerostris darwini]|uniref:Uncharacterized protein n=1 Tax=Caerostris darwini TaxID=1538125 RepID=A0AAV4VRV7_9ARAC|nr:hypothetical protein CDAR_208661 [Caerostris darwini]